MVDLSTAEAVLRDVFGHNAFRFGQQAAVEAVLAGRDVIVLLPTGAGKSSCYQVPAVTLARAGRGTTLVISPLIALMIDQVTALNGRGIRAAALHSHQDDDTRRDVIRDLVRGDLAILYVSPERAALPGFRQIAARSRIALLAIDEAHCVSQWGHDFRPEYMQLDGLRRLVDAPAIALTATATPRVMTEIRDALALRDPAIVRGPFRRDNLELAVEHRRGDDARIAATIAALEAAGLRTRHGRGRGIVYCATRNKTELVAKSLAHAGFAVGHYHAGRTALARERAQTAFGLGKTRVLVATNAFGMGVDYPDVRAIVHYQAPGSLEAYYQEAGRAGRDGEPSRCVLLFGEADLAIHRKLGDGKTGHEAALAAIERYARATTCRQQILCAHFDDACEPCGQCDACREPDAPQVSRPVEIPATALGSHEQQIILDAVGSLSRKVGRVNLALALRGSQAKAVVAHGLLHLPQHGALHASSQDDIVATIDQLIRERRLVRRGRKYPTIALPGVDPRRSRSTSIAYALDRYRKQRARELRWKAYMVFPRSVIAAIDKLRPASLDALHRIPGLGPAKIARFGSDLLALVRRA
ncbi:MAG TPA: RecQ family ATP-dependent DNA helicase [Kofleriaceae bacterium]|nr:RecQ family ATP-dependent DNA helicase [Kofleriaceae bacterium]